MMDTMFGQVSSPFERDQYGFAAVIPEAVRQALGNYQSNPNSLSARNAAFQELYKIDPKTAGRMAGDKNYQGFDGLLGAINAAYNITPQWYQAAQVWDTMTPEQQEQAQTNYGGGQQLVTGLLTPQPRQNQEDQEGMVPLNRRRQEE